MMIKILKISPLGMLKIKTVIDNKLNCENITVKNHVCSQNIIINK